MPEIGELVSVPAFTTDISSECPFTELEGTDSDYEIENVEDDDGDMAFQIQKNNGGTLGSNLKDGIEGKAGTINDCYGTGPLDKVPCNDQRSGEKNITVVEGDDNLYPYIQAAHHLIPGEAALAPSHLFETYMKKDGSVDTGSRTFTIKRHIGYNVNGAHNGVWLPGNYAIRASNSANPSGVSWGDMDVEEWKYWYMIAAMKKCRRQFHDSHPTYSENVMDNLNTMSLFLQVHQDECEDCEGKCNGKIEPPYRIKKFLYAISAKLRGMVSGGPNNWNECYYTSSPLLTRMGQDKKQVAKDYKDASP